MLLRAPEPRPPYNVESLDIAGLETCIVLCFIFLVFQEWNDVNLKWNKSDFGNIQDIRIPPKHIWKPDLLMYNRYNFEL